MWCQAGLHLELILDAIVRVHLSNDRLQEVAQRLNGGLLRHAQAVHII